MFRDYHDTIPNFLTYLKTNYFTSDRELRWSKVNRNRPHAKSDTNMFMESHNNVIKKKFLERQAKKRLDDLLICVEEIELDYFRRAQQGGITSAHEKGANIPDSKVVYVSEVLCLVYSEKNQREVYEVTTIAPSCRMDQCKEKCAAPLCFSLCQHIYTCTCNDNNKLCKHIHKVQTYKHQREQQYDNCPDVMLNDHCPDEMLNDHCPDEVPNDHGKKKSDKKKLILIDNFCKEIKNLARCNKTNLNHLGNALSNLVRKFKAINKYKRQPGNVKSSKVRHGRNAKLKKQINPRYGKNKK